MQDVCEASGAVLSGAASFVFPSSRQRRAFRAGDPEIWVEWEREQEHIRSQEKIFWDLLEQLSQDEAAAFMSKVALRAKENAAIQSSAEHFSAHRSLDVTAFFCTSSPTQPAVSPRSRSHRASEIVIDSSTRSSPSRRDKAAQRAMSRSSSLPPHEHNDLFCMIVRTRDQDYPLLLASKRFSALL